MYKSDSEDKKNIIDGGLKSKKKLMKKKDKKSKIPKKKVSKKVNPWLVHVKTTMKLYPNKDFKDILKLAAKTYKK
jgi:hypothetical protein